MVNLKINGIEMAADEGKTILEAARANNVEIPTLCYHKALPSYGACRLCVVEVQMPNGVSKLEASCTYPVSEGMKVLTNSRRVKKSRKMTIELLLSRCPEEEVLLELAREYGIERPRFRLKDDNCIFCGLCVRMCQRMGPQAINFTGRGMDRELGTPYLETSDVCMTCGACAYICPTSRFTQKKVERISGNRPIPIPSEFNQGLNERPAVYIPFPQAVPKIPVIDKDRCIYYQTGNCKTCETFCEPGAIKFDQEDELVKLDVGTIVIATGFDLYDPSKNPKYGYGNGNNNVLTGLEFERLSSASGPTEGIIEINGEIPRKVVFIQCVGSRERVEGGHHYCSRVCCMYTAKHAHIVKDRLPDSEVTILYTDLRAFGKGFEEFVNRVKDEGITYVRRELEDPIEVIPDADGVVVKAEGHEDMEADLVILATAVVQRENIGPLSRTLKLSRGADDFFLEVHPKLRPMDTATRGIYLAGCCQGPKDIPDTVAQSSGAAAKAIIPLTQGKIALDPQTSSVTREKCSGCGLCVEVCPYTAIALVDGKAEVNEVLCMGCGLCSATCRSGAIQPKGFSDHQLINTIKGYFNEVF